MKDIQFQYIRNFTHKNLDNTLENPSIRLTNVLKSGSKLDPNFVTGLTEAEGSFPLGNNDKAKFKVNIGLRFKITMLSNEIELFNIIKSFFVMVLFHIIRIIVQIVRDVNNINNIIIPHFSNYPLRGTKYSDFLSFKKVVDNSK